LKLFAPAAHANGRALELQPEQIGDFAPQLSAALAGNKDLNACPVIFFSTSFLFALVYAGRKFALEGGEIWISWIKLETATTPSGAAVRFYAVPDLIDQFGISTRTRKDGSAYDYSHEVIATTTVIPGPGSCSVEYSNLVQNGLYHLYPAFEEVLNRHMSKWYLTVEDLREHWLSEPWQLSHEKLQVAFQLAVSFAGFPASTSTTAAEKTRKHILAWFIALQLRSQDDRSLLQWILAKQTTAHELASNWQETNTTSVVEINSYESILALLSKVRIGQAPIYPPPLIDTISVEADRNRYQEFRRANIHKRRQSRAAGNGQPDRERLMKRTTNSRRYDSPRIDKYQRYETFKRREHDDRRPRGDFSERGFIHRAFRDPNSTRGRRYRR
jgi:hypothetical protein